ncbi:MFS transporter [Amycolatopsis pithecellobii]|uniref:MFS transporter n=1 Tax=Amycolatopsis pithecellobii TaxID=664692 RepID=UPI0028AF4F30|nr:MFS transporter [Amycolatopsis pithecellobii]
MTSARASTGARQGWGRLQVVVVAGSTSEGLLLAALPLLAVSVTTDPSSVSLVNMVGQAPWLLLSLFAGVLVDRVRRTTVLMLAYATQCCAAVALAIAGTAHGTSLPLLMIVAFVVTSSQVLSEGASGALLPQLVPVGDLPAANARLQVIDRGLVQFVVPPAAGALLAVSLSLPGGLACVMTVVAFVASRGIRAPVTVPAGRSHPFRDIAEGVRYLVAAPLLRAITVTVALGSFSTSATFTMLVLYSTEELHFGSVGYGALLACLAVGWIISSFVARRLIDRVGYSWALRISQGMAALTPLLVAIAPPWPVAVGAILVAQSAGTLIWNVCSQSTRQRFTPAALLGRVLTSHRALAWGLTPLGALMGGLVAEHWTLRGVWIVAAVVQTIGLLIVWRTMSARAFARTERYFPDA